jgi:hypothetical protein
MSVVRETSCKDVNHVDLAQDNNSIEILDLVARAS